MIGDKDCENSYNISARSIFLRRWLRLCGISMINGWSRISGSASTIHEAKGVAASDEFSTANLECMRLNQDQHATMLIHQSCRMDHKLNQWQKLGLHSESGFFTSCKAQRNESSLFKFKNCQIHTKRIPILCCMNPNFYHYHSFIEPRRRLLISYWKNLLMILMHSFELLMGCLVSKRQGHANSTHLQREEVLCLISHETPSRTSAAWHNIS